MSTYITGETFELPQNRIGLLLEGFIKTQSTLDLITAPAALFPSYSDRSFRVSEIAEVSRARVIMFDIVGFEGTRTRRTSSLISHGSDSSQSPPNREHSGLMSWPERRNKSRQHLEHPNEIDQHGNIFSARANQLSMYGSMISNERKSPRTSLNRLTKQPPKNQSHSRSYTRVPPTENRRPISMRSKGSTTMRNNVSAGQLRVPLINPETNENRGMDYSSDESDGEDKYLVGIDSPSTLSFLRSP